MAADGTRMDADGSFPSSSVLRDRHSLLCTAARDATSGFPRLLTQDLSRPRGNRSHECTRSNPRPIRAILGHPRSRLFYGLSGSSQPCTAPLRTGIQQSTRKRTNGHESNLLARGRLALKSYEAIEKTCLAWRDAALPTL